MLVLFYLIRQPFLELSQLKWSLFTLMKVLYKRFVLWLVKNNRLIFLQKQLLKVDSYAQWDKITKEMDELSGNKFWKVSDLNGAPDDSNNTIIKQLTGMRVDHYDSRKVFHQRKLIEKLRKSGQVIALKESLFQNLEKNMCGTGNEEMYKVCRNGTKLNIELYHNELIESIRYLYYY